MTEFRQDQYSESKRQLALAVVSISAAVWGHSSQCSRLGIRRLILLMLKVAIFMGCRDSGRSVSECVAGTDVVLLALLQGGKPIGPPLKGPVARHPRAPAP